ncbi:hypothetical protein [Phenylobacterium sp.]|uniref:hypothetical protein n=1 Tax=Phenylobacterium sp. TaxID=1871053 RepID=UPI002E333A2B|nr:hypothetical protein [Phenylobacterium sp.]HEX3364573.1 hypothetical protein [Phenylobacterium sp.]
MVTRQDRIDELLRRLAAAEPCETADEALALICDTLNTVEDELSGVAFNPDYPMDDGRMYPPREDARREVDGRPDVRRYRSRGHNILIADHGAFRIELVKGKSCLLSKTGRNGASL